MLKSQISLLLNDKTAAGARSSDSAQWVATRTVSALNDLGDKLWGSANSFMDKATRMAQGTEIAGRVRHTNTVNNVNNDK